MGGKKMSTAVKWGIAASVAIVLTAIQPVWQLCAGVARAASAIAEIPGRLDTVETNVTALRAEVHSLRLEIMPGSIQPGAAPAMVQFPELGPAPAFIYPPGVTNAVFYL